MEPVAFIGIITMHKLVKDEVGNKYGRLTAIEYVADDRSGAYWLCMCNCGNEHTVLGKHLRDGTIKSCGCLAKEQAPKNARRLSKGEAAFNTLYSSYKRRAERKNLCFELTKEQFRSLTKQNCFYCGCHPSSIYNPRYNGGYIYNGVDRVDNIIGYISENCVPCCKDCNKAKGTRSYIEFIDWIERLATKWTRSAL